MLVCWKIFHFEHEFLSKELIVTPASYKNVLELKLVPMGNVCEIATTKIVVSTFYS